MSKDNTGAGGALAGAIGGKAVGRPRWRQTLWMTSGSLTNWMTFIGPEHLGQAVRSLPKILACNSAQVRL